MVPGFEISDNLDWTAIGTMALAIVTGASLLFGWKALRQGQKEVEEAHRPVVVPVVDKTFIDLGSDGSFEKGPQLMRDHRTLVIPVENIGPRAFPRQLLPLADFIAAAW